MYTDLLYSLSGDNLLTAVAVSVTSGMVASHHRVIVIKSSNQSSNSRPSLSYHVLGNEGFNQSLLYSNTASIAVGEVHGEELKEELREEWLVRLNEVGIPT